MRILVVGNGGREHAILWKLRQDAPDAELFVTLGNGGTEGLATAVPLRPGEFAPLAAWAQRERIDLTVVGPDNPLGEGIVDFFASRGLAIFGPDRAAARIESSKAFAKRLMQRHEIPTAAFEIFSEVDPAIEYVNRIGGPVVVKASGLAAGKGALVCETTAEGERAVREVLGGAFGAAGEQVVVEEFMEGEELSVFAISDGTTFVTLTAAQDHKRIGEGDTGPNTGGMGAYAPVSIATPDLIARVESEILAPTLRAMADEGCPFRGILYAGLMVTPTGPRVVEFNSRFGDPEAQVILPLLESSFLELVEAAVRGDLANAPTPRWKAAVALTTILASEGYPGKYETGLPIRIPPDLEQNPDIVIFHAGTAIRDGALVTAGGRVLAVTALAPDIATAAERSRQAAERIQFDNRVYRRDIGWREIRRAGR